MTTKRHPPIGWHTAVQGNPTGIGEYIDIMNKNGVPAVVKCVDGTTGIIDGLNSGKKYGIENVLVVRMELSRPFDVPNYRVAPEVAAIEQWELHMKKFPSNLTEYRKIVWTETMNEWQDIISIPVDQIDQYDMTDRTIMGKTPTGGDYIVDNSSWLALYAHKTATLAVSANVRWLAFGFSGGMPRHEFWQTGACIDFLRYAAEHSDLIGIATHEYSFVDTLVRDEHIGRYKDINNVCDNNGIKRPVIIVTEFGWKETWVPPTEQFLADLEANAAQMYTEDENVLGLCVWYLGGGYKNIANLAQPTIIPSAKWATGIAYDVVPPPDEPIVIDPPLPPPSNSRAVVTLWIPPYQKMSKEQLEEVQRVATYGLPGYTNGGHTISPAHEDAAGLIICNGNNRNSMLLVMFPDTISGDEDFDWGGWFADTYGGVLDTTILFVNDEYPTEPPPEPEFDELATLPDGSYVVDVSNHNQFVNMETTPKVSGLIVRSGNGLGKVASCDEQGRDKKLHRWVQEAVDNDLPFGLYHFINKTDDLVRQIDLFSDIVDEITDKYGNPTLGLWLDFENTEFDNGGFETEAEIKECFERLESLGHSANVIGAYTRASWWNQYVPKSATWPKKYNLWVAHYMTNPELAKPNWKFSIPNGWVRQDTKLWQFTSVGGTIINWPYKNIDVNYWYSDDSPYLSGTYPLPVPGEYTGVPVKFVGGIDQPASDWYWAKAKVVYDETPLYPLFHSSGNSHLWFPQYKSETFNIVRVILDEQDLAAYIRTAISEIGKYWGYGQRDFVLLNEPNLPQEGLGKLWKNGIEFGAFYNKLTSAVKSHFKDIRLWGAPMSPWRKQAPPGIAEMENFMREAISQGAFTFCYGMVCHAYTVNLGALAGSSEIVKEVLQYQKDYSLDKPLVVGEFSVVVPGSGELKSNVYKEVYRKLAEIKGVQGGYSFTSSWHPSPDTNQEGWLENGIYKFF